MGWSGWSYPKQQGARVGLEPTVSTLHVVTRTRALIPVTRLVSLPVARLVFLLNPHVGIDARDVWDGIDDELLVAARLLRRCTTQRAPHAHGSQLLVRHTAAGV